MTQITRQMIETLCEIIESTQWGDTIPSIAGAGGQLMPIADIRKQLAEISDADMADDEVQEFLSTLIATAVDDARTTVRLSKIQAARIETMRAKGITDASTADEKAEAANIDIKAIERRDRLDALAG